MSSASDDLVLLRCPGCQRLLRVPQTAAGQICRCPGCGRTTTVPDEAVADAEVIEEATSAPRMPGVQIDVPAPASPQPAESPIPHIKTRRPRSLSRIVRANAEADALEGYSYVLERYGIGMTAGGLAMMGIAVVWFVVGLAAGRIFFFPPILFLLGLFALLKALLDTYTAAKRRRREAKGTARQDQTKIV